MNGLPVPDTFDTFEDIDGGGLQLGVRPATPDDREWLRRLLRHRWQGTRIVARGVVHDADALPALIAEANGERIGLATYRLAPPECELITLDSMLPARGVGGALLERVAEVARAAGCRRIQLVTTNDNLAALRFYQKRGFALAALHRGALDESRRLKPTIPTTGRDGIPLRDELELERAL